MRVSRARFGGGSVRAGRRRARPKGRWTRAGPEAGLPADDRFEHPAGRRAEHPAERDGGSAAAEFAVAVPAVILVLACCLGAVQVASQQVRLADAAADAARTLARGDSAGVAAARVSRAVPTASMSRSTEGDFVCVLLSAPAGIGPAGLAGVRVQASSCALAGGL
ncbi:hypothetical protein IWX78_002432 [Mycetocola sp. CAN_C7]|uniref:TadE family type IV pilus minor pilin n=1 Tax=Mycetocola sp. CAN_C7 TaxID=2787724 RepID=UPI0018C92A38